MNNDKLQKMVLTSLFIALSIIIPIQFGFLKVVLGPFTATLASHVPMFFSMLISPAAAIVVGIGSALGFVLSGLPIYVVARASMHIIVGAVGALAIRKGMEFKKVILITAPIHGLLEAISVIPFYGLNVYKILVVVALGTVIHHLADGAISLVLLRALSRATGKDLSKSLLKQSAN